VVYQGSGGFATAGAAGEVAGQVTDELIQLLKILAEPKTRTELQETLEKGSALDSCSECGTKGLQSAGNLKRRIEVAGVGPS